MYYVISNHLIQHMKILIDYGYDLDKDQKMIGDRCLIMATSSGNYDMVLYMLEHGANPLMKDKYNYTFIDDMKGNGERRIAMKPDQKKYYEQVKEYLIERDLW